MTLLDRLGEYATQPSTWKGALKLLASVGLITVSPEVQDILVGYAIKIIGGVWAIVGIVDVIRNERKQA